MDNKLFLKSLASKQGLLKEAGEPRYKHVIRKAKKALYLQKDNSWGPYETAKRFPSLDDAGRWGQLHYSLLGDDWTYLTVYAMDRR